MVDRDRVVALEEHVVTADVIAAWRRVPPRWQDLALAPSTQGESGRRLGEIGEERLAAMDAAGVDVQVLSLTAPGLQNVDAADAVVLQRDVNDRLADAVRHRPDRFEAFATLATAAEDAAAELERAVTHLGMSGAMIFGRTRDRHLDDPRHEPLLAAAAALGAPLYLHPQSPPPAVRRSYYDGTGSPALDAALATHGVGWHYDCGLELLRLIVSGVFDRHPRLQVITGHWGEMVVFFHERIDTNLSGVAGLDRPISSYLRSNVYVTPSGILSRKYLRWAAETVGTDRILYATDYPFVPTTTTAADFLGSASLTPQESRAVASGNWERLRSGIDDRGRP
jgi:uncharacterized protein